MYASSAPNTMDFPSILCVAGGSSGAVDLCFMLPLVFEQRVFVSVLPKTTLPLHSDSGQRTPLKLLRSLH